MANKKLSVELELDSREAKKKVEELTASAGNGVTSTSDAIQRSNVQAIEKSTKSLESFSSQTNNASSKLGSIVKSFAGMAIGLASQYAASNYDKGSIEQRTLSYGGSMMTGAAAGSMAGPWGAVAGALIGGLKEYLGEEALNKEQIKSFNKSEEDYHKTRDWSDKFRELTTVNTDFGKLKGLDLLNEQLKAVEGPLEEVKIAIGRIQHEETEAILKIKAALESKNETEREEAESSLRFAREKLHQLEAADRQLSSNKKNLEIQIRDYEDDNGDPFRTSLPTNDSLTRVGGSFTGGTSSMNDLLQIQRMQVELLKRIESKSGKERPKFV